jgi:methyltransferase (TIGR00027 family)
MRDSTASHTALRVAVRRAEHQVLDHPRLFEDPLSVRIIGPEAAARIQPGVISRRQRLTPSFRAFMAVRSRYAEDELARFVEREGHQYVILGAGLDTFAFRNPYPGLHVYEVDHPATQAWKKERLAAADIDIPATVTFVAANFERRSLAEALAATGFDFSRPAFFSWLGVVMYLSEDAFSRTLEFMAARPPRSAIVFDYAVERESLNAVQKKAFDALAARVSAMGEPFRLFFDPPELHARLREAGLTDIEDLGREQINARYFAGRTDDFRVRANLARLLRAVRYQSAGL